ncbi:MAG: ROK family protein [Candidatus Methylomirabilales bacterium]
MNLVLAIDIGGTKLAAGIVERSGGILARGEVPTRAADGPEAVLDRIVALGTRLLGDPAARGVTGVGVCSPGPLDRAAGVVLSPPNLPGWDRVPLVSRLRAAFGLPVVLDNDANAAALAEFRYGAGRGACSLAYFTVSTGIGGGIVLDGKLRHGVGDAAGEFGHMTVLPDGPACPCGNRGCLETLASGTAIARAARERLSGPAPSRLRDVPDVTAAEVARFAAAGDRVAREVWERAVRFLAQGVATVVTILAPERVVLGGGVTEAGELLFAPLREEVRRRVGLVPVEKIPIVRAALRRDVGILGAAALCLTPSESGPDSAVPDPDAGAQPLGPEPRPPRP